MIKYVFFVIILLTRLSLFAEESQGEVLDRQLWENIKNGKWGDIENAIAPYFQYVSFDEVLNKEQYIAHAKSLNVSEYTISKLSMTEGPGIRVVTYDIATSETVKGKEISSNATRLTVWQKNSNKWQMITHAVFIPLPIVTE